LENDGSVTVCTSPPPTTCNEGICVPSAPGLPSCVLAAGELPCPREWPTKTVVVTTRDIHDTRSCTDCKCNNNATQCTAASLALFDDTTCTHSVGTPTVSRNCSSLADVATPTYYRYTASPDINGCTPSASTVPITGTVSLPPASTLCCR